MLRPSTNRAGVSIYSMHYRRMNGRYLRSCGATMFESFDHPRKICTRLEDQKLEVQEAIGASDGHQWRAG
jgi:hypothetical protein